MKKYFVMLFSIIVIGSISGMGYLLFKESVGNKMPEGKVDPVILQNNDNNEINNAVTLVDFSSINSEFLFSAKVPKELKVEYIPQLRAINIYNSNMVGISNIEKSQIYITFFRANRFLTLNTVEITQQDKMYINGKDAILYEITKKEAVPNFTGQPLWRNVKHKAIDIRHFEANPSYFYSFAKNPDVSQKVFDDVINSLVFIND